MSVASVLSAIQATALAHAITKSNHMVIASLQIVHVFGFLLLLTSLVLMSLRVLGLALPGHSLQHIVALPKRLFWCGLAVAILTGCSIFLTGTKHYYYNRAFELKMALLLGGVLLQFFLFSRIIKQEAPPPVLARLVVALSLLVWFGVGAAGRAIGFV